MPARKIDLLGGQVRKKKRRSFVDKKIRSARSRRNIKKGLAFERAVRRYLESRGLFATRRPKSAHPDLIAIVPGTGRAILIECKAHLPDFKDRERLWQLAEWLNTPAYIAYLDPETNSLRFMEVRRGDGVEIDL